MRYFSLLLAGAATLGVTLPSGAENWLNNGEFADGLAHYRTVSTPAAEVELLTTGFESAEALRLVVPESAEPGDNYVVQRVEVPADLATRHCRVTFWMQVKALPDAARGGAGVAVRFLDADGKELGRSGRDRLHHRRTDQMNEWQKIDYMKDMWWQNYAVEFDLPPECRALELEIGLFDIWGELEVDRVILRNQPSVAEALDWNDPVTLTATTVVTKENLSPLLFTANADYFHNGTYFGTLPADDPANRRAAFAAALREAGITALRFPGGMPCHDYQVAGQSYQHKAQHYPEALRVLDFCTENGLELMFQTNSARFVDDDGQVQTIFDDPWRDDSPDRVAAAARDLARFIATIPADQKITYWEIGNEEFSMMTVGNYAKIIEAFVPVIRARFPEAVVTVTGNVWPRALAERLNASGFADQVQYLAAHYPWGEHWRPESDTPAGRVDLERFLMSRLSWDLNAEAHLRLAAAGGVTSWRMSGSETSAFPFHVWDESRVIFTPAQGLNFAHQWIEAMQVPSIDILAHHDLDSTYFGMVLFDPYWDGASGHFRPIREQTERPADCPSVYWLPRQYLVLPSGLAQQLLNRHQKQAVLATRTASPEAALYNFDSLLTRSADGLLLTVVNRSRQARRITLDLAAWPVAAVQYEELSWSELGARPGAENRRFGTVTPVDGQWTVELAAYSITQFQIKFEETK